MKKSATGERLLMVGVGAVVLLVVASVGLQMVTDRNRDAAVARLKRSDAVARYQEAHPAKPKSAAPAPHTAEAAAPPVAEASSDSVAEFAKAFTAAQKLRTGADWGRLEQELQGKSLQERTDEDWARAKSILDQNRELILEIRHLAEVGGPAHILDFSKGLAMELPHLAKVRGLARILREDALAQSRSGNMEEAAADIMAALKLSRVTKDEPVLISQLVRFAICGVACQTAQDALPAQGLAPDIARTLIDYAANVSYRDSFADSFSGEGTCGLGSFDKLRNGDPSDFSPSSTWEQIGLQLYSSAFARPLVNMDEEAYTETLTRMGEISWLPYYEAKPQMDALEHDIENMSRLRVMSRTMLPALTRAIDAEARNETSLRLLQVGLSIEQYHNQNGAWPDSLDALAPSFGGNVPMDPYTGRPFVYKPTQDNFVLYSVATNGVDDDGKFDYRQGDIVWRGTPVKPKN